MKYTKEQKAAAWEHLKAYKGQTLLAIINSVSRSGMSRRIEFYGIGKGWMDKGHKIDRLGYWIAQVIDYPYNVDKGGLLVNGCGMDMIFHMLYSVNMAWIHKMGEKYSHTGSTLHGFFSTDYTR